MKTIITVSELLSKIKKTKKEFESLYKEYIDPETSTNSRYMVSLYNPASGKTVNGINPEEVVDEIRNINAKIMSATYNLKLLTTIKDQVNMSSAIRIIDAGQEKDISVYKAVMLKSKKFKDYRLQYLYKLKESYTYGNKKLAEHNQSIMSGDKVDRYVLAKMNSLNIPNTQESLNANYNAFASEYRAANELSIIDPLQIKDLIDSEIEKAEEFYRELDTKLFAFNATTRIWIDLEAPSDDQLWGFIR